MKQIFLGLYLVVLSGAASGQVTPMVRAPQPRTNVVVSVGDFLVDAAGVPVTPYKAFAAAVDSARAQQAARLVIPPGRYVFSDPEILKGNWHILLTQLEDLEIDEQGSELVFGHPSVQGLVLAACQRLVLRNFSIEYSGTLASPGVVQKLPDGRTAIRIRDDYPAGAATRFGAVSEFDVAARRWKASRAETYDVQDVTMIAPQTFVARAFKHFADGAEVLIRHHVYGSNAVAGFLSSFNDVAFEDITVYSAPGKAFFFASTGKGIRLTRCVVKRKPDQLISVTADGAHFTTTGGHIIVEDCDFSGQGDDSLNIGADWLVPLAQLGPVTLDVKFAFASTFYIDCVVPGVELSFRDGATFAEVSRRRVVSVTPDVPGRRYRVTLDQPVDVPPNALIGIEGMDSAVYLVRNNRFHDHRGRGMVLAAAKGRIENNVVSDTTMSGLNILADSAFFFEGYGVHDLQVTGNRFERCNFAGERTFGETLGAVNVFAEGRTAAVNAFVHTGLVFENNEITETRGLAMYLSSTRDVLLRHNRIADANSSPDEGTNADMAPCSVYISHASEVRISSLDELRMGVHASPAVCVDAGTTTDVSIGERRRRSVRAR
jgi:hypothetical protein